MGNAAARKPLEIEPLAAEETCPDSGRRQPERGCAVVPLAFDRQAEVNARGSVLEISGRGGDVELTVRITSDGPVLEFKRGRVALQSEGDLDLDCRNLTLRSSGTTKLESGGDFEQVVNGGYSVQVRDDARLAAQAVQLVAELGELALRANDDVALNGLRVLLNVPSEEEIIDREKAAQSIEALLRRPFDGGDGPRRMPPSSPKKREIE